MVFRLRRDEDVAPYNGSCAAARRNRRPGKAEKTGEMSSVIGGVQKIHSGVTLIKNKEKTR